jgi:hypothetical protein
LRGSWIKCDDVGEDHWVMAAFRAFL